MRPTWLTAALPGLVLAALALGCNSNVKVHDYTYTCTTSADCIQGYTCIANVCSTGSDASASDTGSGNPDTGGTGKNDVDDSPHCTSSDVTCLTTCGTNKCPLLLYKCNEDLECKTAMLCYAGCSTAPCRVKCLNNVPPGSQAALNALQECLSKKCM